VGGEELVVVGKLTRALRTQMVALLLLYNNQGMAGRSGTPS